MPYQTSRRSGRLSMQLPILLIGTSAEGRIFTEKTRTVVLSLHGAGIVAKCKLAPEQELILRSLESNREAGIRVLGEIGSEANIFTYGVAFVDEQLDFWNVNFPPHPTGTILPEPLYLECNLCHSPHQLEHGDFEFDVCAIHGGLVRYCEQCGFATVWKVAAQPSMPNLGILFPERTLASAVLQIAGSNPDSQRASKSRLLALEFPAEPVFEPLPNRRVHRRARVNYCACVRTRLYGDDIVACIDMSRGGVALKTKRAYMVGTEILIAVPFSRESPQAPAIFVPAKIATRTVMPDNSFFRCGVQFLPQTAEGPYATPW
jgi:hypothetical protein